MQALALAASQPHLAVLDNDAANCWVGVRLAERALGQCQSLTHVCAVLRADAGTSRTCWLYGAAAAATPPPLLLLLGAARLPRRTQLLLRPCCQHAVAEDVMVPDVLWVSPESCLSGCPVFQLSAKQGGSGVTSLGTLPATPCCTCPRITNSIKLA